MANEYWVAWLLLYLFGGLLTLLCVYPIRKHVYLALFVAGMGILWMLIPIPFNSDYSAPLFVVLLFHLFFEPDASYAFSATAAILGSATVLAAVLLVYALNLVIGKQRNSRLHKDSASDASVSTEIDSNSNS